MKQMFTKEWVYHLKEKLGEFIQEIESYSSLEPPFLEKCLDYVLNNKNVEMFMESNLKKQNEYKVWLENLEKENE